jgi:hypothetical protein
MIVGNARAPRESYPAILDHVTAGKLLDRPGPAVRIAARVRAHRLDGTLIAGGDPSASRKLAARAATLTSRRSRSLLASGLDQLVRSARAPACRMRVRPHRSSILANAEELGELASMLRGRAPLYASGIAALGALMADPSSPAYLGDRDALTRRLRAARAAMSGGEPAGPKKPNAQAKRTRANDMNEKGGTR